MNIFREIVPCFKSEALHMDVRGWTKCTRPVQFILGEMQMKILSYYAKKIVGLLEKTFTAQKESQSPTPEFVTQSDFFNAFVLPLNYGFFYEEIHLKSIFSD